MISSYLTRPLRTLEQALEDRARPVDPDFDEPGSVELLVRLLAESTDQQRSPLDRSRAA
jgi:hypothetical protein